MCKYGNASVCLSRAVFKGEKGGTTVENMAEQLANLHEGDPP